MSSYNYVSTAGVIPLGNLVAGGLSAGLALEHALLVMSVAGVAVSAVVAALPSVRSLPRAR